MHILSGAITVFGGDQTCMEALAPGLSAEFRIGFDAYSETWDARSKQYLYESNIAHLDNSGIPTDTVNTQYGKEEKQLGFNSWLNNQNRHSNIQFALNYQKDFSQSNLFASIRYKQDKNVYLGQYNTYMHQDVIASGHYGLVSLLQGPVVYQKPIVGEYFLQFPELGYLIKSLF